jgi:hypothetical protein
MTSVAQVFNERGEGIIVKGAQAELDKNDRQPHLSRDDAKALLKNAIAVYRKEHHIHMRTVTLIRQVIQRRIASSHCYCALGVRR